MNIQESNQKRAGQNLSWRSGLDENKKVTDLFVDRPEHQKGRERAANSTSFRVPVQTNFPHCS
jgi:hypothetical protein